MPLTKEQQTDIRDEEFFRHEIRKELAGRKAAPTFLERCSAFFETKAGFWLLTTVLAGLAATGYTTLQKHLDRAEIAEREAVERSRRDTDTMLKLGPMLTSEKRTQVDMAIVLLDGLALDKAVDARVAGQIRALVSNTLAAGLRTNATSQEKVQADAIIAYVDRARVAAIQRPEVETSATVPPAIDSAALPVRVYMQVANDRDREKAERTNDALRKAGVVTPAIEIVPKRSVPRVNDLRYCDGKADSGAIDRVKSIVSTILVPAPKVVVLAPNLCKNVRFNHFEVWIAPEDA